MYHTTEVIKQNKLNNLCIVKPTDITTFKLQSFPQAIYHDDKYVGKHR